MLTIKTEIDTTGAMGPMECEGARYNNWPDTKTEAGQAIMAIPAAFQKMSDCPYHTSVILTQSACPFNSKRHKHEVVPADGLLKDTASQLRLRQAKATWSLHRTMSSTTLQRILSCIYRNKLPKMYRK